MNKYRFIRKAIGLTLVIGGFIMATLHLLVDWDVITIGLPEVFFSFYLILMWIGIVIYQYRPNLSLTAKRLSWVAVIMFCILLLTMIVSRGTWIYRASEFLIIISGLLALIAWMKITYENQHLEDGENEDDEKN